MTYTATGKFATPALNGTDIFKLAGQSFTITSMLSASLPPTSHGAYYAIYSNIKVTGTIHSGLVKTPFPLSTNAANLELATGNASYDSFSIGAPINVLGLTVNFIADIKMPLGTITKPLIHPFSAPVTLSPSNTSVVYSDSSSGATTLAVASGTLTATIPAAPTAELRTPFAGEDLAPAFAPESYATDGLPRKMSLTTMLRSLYRAFWCSGCEG